MRQRVMIAMAIASPKLLIADEPTTALDVTIQAQILDLLDQLRQEFGMAMILITHDMGVIARTAERVLVMYAGRVAEGRAGEVGVQVGGSSLYGGPVRAFRVSATLAPTCTQSPEWCRARACCPLVADSARVAPAPSQSAIVPSPPAINIGNGHSAACLVHTGFELSETGRTPEARGPAEPAP